MSRIKSTLSGGIFCFPLRPVSEVVFSSSSRPSYKIRIMCAIAMLRIIQTEHQLSTTINCHWYLSLLILLIKAYCVSLSLIDGASIIYFLSTEQVLFQARKKIIDLFIKNNMESEDIFEVYRIVDKRTELGKVEYLVQWKHYAAKYNTWEPMVNLAYGCDEMVTRFETNRCERIIGARKVNGQLVYLVKLLYKPVIEEMVFYHVEQHLPRLLIAFLESQLRFVVGNPESNFPDINEMNAPMNPPLRIIYATDIGKTLKYLVEYGGRQHKFVNASFAHRHFPQMVIRFLEMNLCFNSSN